MINNFKKTLRILTEESSAWIQFKMTFKTVDLSGWEEFFDKDFPTLNLQKFKTIMKSIGEDDLVIFFKQYKTPGEFLLNGGASGSFIKQLKPFSDVYDADEFIRIITDKYTK